MFGLVPYAVCMTATNGPEPEIGSWVMASYSDCPTRLFWERRASGLWIDKHGCVRSWDDLIDPIDCFSPDE